MNDSFSSSTIDQEILKEIFETISDNELFICSLCTSMCNNQNKHQLVSTQCGHLFGKNCIRKRLKQTNQCPICSKILSTRREQQLRTMCLSSVVTIFPAEISRLRVERRKLRIKLNHFKVRFQRATTLLKKTRRSLQLINEKMLKSRIYR